MESKKGSSQNSVIPPLEFQSLILPFYTQALMTLGRLTLPSEKPQPVNLDLAKRLIELLDLLKVRTKGNLDEQEQQILDQSLISLKAVYLEKINPSS